MSISEFPCLSDEEIKLYIAAGCKNLGNKTSAREYEGVLAAFEAIANAPLPTVPTIQYVSGVNKTRELWVNAHQEIVAASKNGRYVQLDCGHYVHNFESERIAKEIKEFIGSKSL